MIDTHMHLIPGMDDGAEDMEMALVMMIRAKQQGISQIIATPHSEAFHFSKEDGRVIFNEINTLPGFTKISMYPMMMDAIGYPIGMLMDELIDSAGFSK